MKRLKKKKDRKLEELIVKKSIKRKCFWKRSGKCEEEGEGAVPSTAKKTCWPSEFLTAYLLFVSKPVRTSNISIS